MVISTTTPQEMPFAAAAQEVKLSVGAPDPMCYPLQLPSCLLPALWGTRSSPTAPPLPSHLTGSKTQQAPGQCKRERKHETEPVGKSTQWGIACPQAVPTKQVGALPFTPGIWLGWRATAALVPGRECQAFSGYKAFLGSRPKHSPADHTARQSLQLP